MASELEILGMGVLELGHHHHGIDATFSTSSSSSAAYGSCGGAAGDAYLYGLLPTPVTATAAPAPTFTAPVDDLLHFSAKDGLFLEAPTAAAADVTTYSYHAFHHHLIPHHQQQQQQAFQAGAYGAAPAASGSYSLLADHLQHATSAAGSDLAAFPDDLYIPSEEAAELEWLSKFVDDSRDVPFHIPGISTTATGFAPAGTTTANSNTNHQYSTSHAPTAASTILTRVDPDAVVMIPGRARSKRSRVTAPAGAGAGAAAQGESAASSQVGTASLTWSSSPLAQQQLTSPSSSSSSSSETKQPGSWVNSARKKRETAVPSPFASAGQDGLADQGGAVCGGGVRRCTHCSSEKTPQWRTGPLGPKTLCNACGVRYKSGRLVPEYRPAASPTFILTQHSNSHRKVMELRRQKELLMRHQQQLDTSSRGIAAASAAILAGTRPDLLLRDFEVC